MPESEHLVETLTSEQCGTLSEARSHISIDSAVVHFSPKTYSGYSIPALTS